MINLDHAGLPRDDQLPNLDPDTLRRLANQIADAAQARAATPMRIHRSWVRTSSLIAAAAVAAAIGVFAMLPTPPADAASWLATPTAAEGAARTGLASECQKTMDSSASAVLVEQRGTSNLTVLADSSECLNAAGLGGMRGTLITSARNAMPDAKPTAGGLQVIGNGALSGIGQVDERTGATEMVAGYMGVIGRVGADVRSVVVHTPGQPDITASLQNGWVAAWWPSLQDPAGLTVTNTTGTYRIDL